MTKQGKKSKFGLGLLFGAVGGAVAGLLFAPQKGEKSRALVKKKAKQIKSWLKEKEVDKKVEKFWGKASVEGRKVYRQTKKKIIKGLANLKGGLSEINKEKYMSVVDKAVDDLRKEKKVSKTRGEKLKNLFVSDWKRIKKKVGSTEEKS